MPKSDPETLAYHRAWRMQNPEKVRAAKARHKKTAKYRETLSAYRASRKEAHRIEVAKWRAKNPDKEAGYYQKRRNKLNTTNTRMIYKWIGQKPTGDMMISAWPYKKDMPQVTLYDSVIRIDFGLSIGYSVIRNNAINLRNGEWMPIFKACLNTPGWVIGMRDAAAADIARHPWADEWRGAFYEARLEAFQNSCS